MTGARLWVFIGHFATVGGQRYRVYGGDSDAAQLERLAGGARKVFQAMRSPAGEEMVLQKNVFVENPARQRDP